MVERPSLFVIWIQVILLALPALTAVSVPASAQGHQGSLEYAVKATFLYKFGHFVEWPEPAFDAPDSPVNICVVGQNPFGDMLDQAVADQRIGDRPIMTRYMPSIETPGDCHIIYSAGSKAQPVAAILKASRGSHALTVTDAARSRNARGIVHFVVEDKRVRFAIDDQAAAANGITISSKLLGLAVFVKPRGMRQ